MTGSVRVSVGVNVTVSGFQATGGVDDYGIWMLGDAWLCPYVSAQIALFDYNNKCFVPREALMQ